MTHSIYLSIYLSIYPSIYKYIHMFFSSLTGSPTGILCRRSLVDSAEGWLSIKGNQDGGLCDFEFLPWYFWDFQVVQEISAHRIMWRMSQRHVSLFGGELFCTYCSMPEYISRPPPISWQLQFLFENLPSPKLIWNPSIAPFQGASLEFPVSLGKGTP